ncbi:unnamed protein product [Penicillium roqueforti FM164]|uniref:Genomic scaffold, ProqFM164S02 n=1 Tax=Penicillium roqueforti (strain FM164) TaxID=1365484 RepID=W6QEF3_PENRF|nr:unnamed protein product [Penicillium roqueforti FM164]
MLDVVSKQAYRQACFASIYALIILIFTLPTGSMVEAIITAYIPTPIRIGPTIPVEGSGNVTKYSRPSTVWLNKSAFCNKQLSLNLTASLYILPPTIQKTATAFSPAIYFLELMEQELTEVRALATLGPEIILLTQSGDIKIIGVENSCEIKESEINPVTMKLCALADIITKLMLKNRIYE